MAVATHDNATYGVSLSPVYIQNGIQRKAKGGIKSRNKCCWRRNVPIRADMKNKPKKLDLMMSVFGTMRTYPRGNR